LFRPGRDVIAPLVIVAAAAMLTAGLASAQNLDAGKSPEKLFADGCVSCHHSPRGLSKGRLELTLAWFLKDHYAASSDSARTLAAYISTVDAAKPRAAGKQARSPKHPPRPKSESNSESEPQPAPVQ
jgi:hypothetical protein